MKLAGVWRYLKTARWANLAAALVVALLLKGGLLLADVVPFNADEAVVGVMARHILQGERRVFFYGQASVGSLDAWLIAGVFAVGGQSALAMRLMQVALYLSIIATTYALGLKIYRSVWMAGAAALFLALPVVLVTLYTTVTQGGCGELLLIGNLLLLLALELRQPRAETATWRWLLFGLLSGVGFWTSGLVLVYWLPAAALLAAGQRERLRKRAGQGWGRAALQWLGWAAGFTAGASPWLWFTLTRSSDTLLEMFGTTVSAGRPDFSILAVLGHVYNLILFGLTVMFGLRPPWGARFLALPLVPYALVIYTALTLFIFHRSFLSHDAARRGRLLLVGCVLTQAAMFILTPLGADPSGRYFLPVMPALALLLADLLRPLRQWLHYPALPPATGTWLARGRALALGVLLLNFWGNLQCAAAFPPGFTTQSVPNTQVDQRHLPELAAFLRAQGETRGYTNYWVAFPLAFLTGDDLVFAARLPYRLDLIYGSRDNRYPPYAQMVDQSARVAYITALQPGLDQRLSEGFGRLGVTYLENQIGDYHIFYALSRKVTPEELGLPVGN